MSAAGRILAVDDEPDVGIGSRVLETYVGSLRRKLGEPPLVHTVRGVGYALRRRRPASAGHSLRRLTRLG